jgi:hypothetical protein
LYGLCERAAAEIADPAGYVRNVLGSDP